MNRSSQAPLRPRASSLFLGFVVITVTAIISTAVVVFAQSRHLVAIHEQEGLDKTAMMVPLPGQHALLRGAVPENNDAVLIESMNDLRKRLPPSIWTTRKPLYPVNHNEVAAKLTNQERTKAMELCGSFLYSTLQRAITVQGDQTFVATGDIDKMWTRDSTVQMSIYLNRPEKWLRLLVEGALRRNAFNIVQDPWGNAYERTWKDPSQLELKEQVIGRGGWVATRNYELDSGAYFMQQLYDYYVQENDFYNPESLLQEVVIVEAVQLLVDVMIVEQNHDEQSPYRYFELPEKGKGTPTAYTGMTWTGFRPSDDATKYGYLVPANIHAAAALERILVINERVWNLESLKTKATKLLKEMEDGINKHGIVESEGEKIYAYEVDGKGGQLIDFDDANVPSLLSIPLLGWSGYNEEVYRATRKRLLSKKNSYYFEGKVLKGIGSPHTPPKSVWPMALAVQGLTATDEDNVVDSLVFQLRQSLLSACNDAMHEGVNVDVPCNFSRKWFEWANALFVILVETSLGVTCDSQAKTGIMKEAMHKFSQEEKPKFYTNRYQNSHDTEPLYYQGIEARIPFK